MAAIGAWTKGYLKLGGVDLTDHTLGFALTQGAEEIDMTTFGDATRQYGAGYKNWALTAEMDQDFAAASVHATLSTLLGSTLAVVARWHSTLAVGSTNPNFTGGGVLLEYPPLDGSPGERLTVNISIRGNGTLSASTST